ncbi:MAG: sensor histidine kinase [Candidatus Cloacimonetes bacterium]|nr:sensor histidine kinase [Candidatus Cloacimonadota bacterium]
MRKISILILINLVISALLTILMSSSDPDRMLTFFLVNLIFANCIGFSIYILLTIINLTRFPFILRIFSSLIFILAGGFLGGIAGTFLAAKLLNIEISFLNLRTLSFFLPLILVLGASAYAIFLLIGGIESNKIRFWKERQARTQAELISLRNRINPHFLFNTLNSISGLIYSDQAKAEEMIEQLSELLRYNLQMAEKPLISIEAELKAIADYLKIEKIRFGDRLTYQIKNEIVDLQLPPLLLLTLVENAVKHGIAKSVSGGKVEILLSGTAEKVSLEVFNTGCGLESGSGESTGLATLRELLRIQYQEKAQFSLTSESGGTLARIEISRRVKV